MKHVRLRLDAHGCEAEIHPMYDVLINAPYLDRATAMHWNFTGDELGIMHYIDGAIEPFRERIDTIEPVLAYELTPANENGFYAYIRDATTEPLRTMFAAVTHGPSLVIPPIEFTADGTLTYSVFGPSGEIQAGIERVPDPVEVSITEVTGMAATPGVLETLLSARQREAIEAALSAGYYEIPRSSGIEAIADDIDCAPSTASEHLRKAESTLLRSMLKA